MEHHNLIVVGGGIMGTTLSECVKKRLGWDVLVLDDGRPLSGTAPSGGSIKPSKLTGIGGNDEKRMLKVLDDAYGIHKIRFSIRPSGGFLKADVWQVDLDVLHTLQARARLAAVKSILFDEVAVMVGFGEEEETIHADKVVVAAGMGCADLIPGEFPVGTLIAKMGVSFRFAGQVKEPFVQAWAPYKQITVHNIGNDTIWAADGSALIPENWMEERTKASLHRCQAAMGIKEDPISVTLGLRPFHSGKAKPCFLKQVVPNVWVITGAGKFGCISAGWAADHLATTFSKC